MTLEVLRIRPWIQIQSRILAHFESLAIPIPEPDPSFNDLDPAPDPDPSMSSVDNVLIFAYFTLNDLVWVS